MMALSRSMKDLMHRAATERRSAAGNPATQPGGNSLAQRVASMKSKALNQRATAATKPRPPAGTFDFVNQGGRGTQPLQQATAAAKTQALAQRAAPRTAKPTPTPTRAAGAMSRYGGARERLARQVGAREGPPARRGSMPRAFGSRRYLR